MLFRIWDWLNIGGSGIPRIITKLKECGLQELEFIGGDTDLRINIYRDRIKVNDLNCDLNNLNDDNDDLNNDLEKQLLHLIELDAQMTMKQYAEKLKVSDSTVKRILTRLQKECNIVREG